MKNSLESRLGIFFALALLAIVVIMELSSGMDLFNKGDLFKARFKNIQELKVGDAVKMSGFQIGKVADINLAGGEVEVTMRIWKEYKLGTDSQASIGFVGLMGRNFVSIQYGTSEAPEVQPGSFIETVEQPDFGTLMSKLEDVADGVQDVTKSFSGDNFSELLAPLTDFINRNGPKLDEVFSNLEAISTQVASGQGTVGRLIYEDEMYHSTLNTVSNMNEELTLAADDFRAMLNEARGVVTDIKAGKGTIGLLATDERLYTETADAMMNLKEILEKINVGQGSIGQLVNDESFLQNMRLTIQKLERATDTMEDLGPMTIIGTLAGSLF